MSGENRILLDVFEKKLKTLLTLCEEQQRKIEELTQQINMKQVSIQQTEKQFQALNATYSDLLIAHVASLEEGDVKSAKSRLEKLVREVDKCVALLNG